MRYLTAEEIQRALKRPPKNLKSEDKPDFTSATPEPRLEPSVMPTGQEEL